MRDVLARPVVSVYLEPNRPIYAAVAVMDIVVLDIALKNEEGNAVDLTGCSVVVAAQDREKTVLYTGNIVEPLAGAVRVKVQPDVAGRYALSARVCTSDTEDVTFFLGAMSVAAEDPDAGPAGSIRSLTQEMIDAKAQATSGIETLSGLIDMTTAATNSANAASSLATEAANAANAAANAANEGANTANAKAALAQSAADSANTAANTAAAATQALGDIDALVAGRVQEANTAASNAASSEEQAASSASAAAASQQSAAQSADSAASSASAAAESQTAAAASAAAALASQNAAQTAQSSAASSAEQSAASANAAAASQQSAAQSAEAAAQTAQSVNQWCHRGEWASGTDYLSGEGYIDVVEHDGSSYVCLAAHQATTANEPGVGANSADFWRLLAEKGNPGFVFTPALVDGVLNWTNNGGLSNPASVDLFKAPTEGVQNLGTMTGNTTINCALGNYVIMTIGASLTLSFTAAANGRLRVLTLELINGGSATVTWPASVKWGDGAAPVLTAAGKDVITLMTRDNGATWYGTVVGSDFK
ncbi:carbohydrate-binding protein [Pyramidobacter sp.]|uniref:carbohydrate-binding protein n=1 Tax=Pyramidobacter sp. TaxID=1943581 RepID=UPI00332ED765